MRDQNQNPIRSTRPLITPTSYSTTDLYLAGFLAAVGAKLVEVVREGQRSTLTFSDPDFCQEYSRRYHTGDDDEVSASAFAASVKRMKHLALKGGF